VTVFKEDFDQERRDREASRTATECLENKLRESDIELGATKQKVETISLSVPMPLTANCCDAVSISK